MLEFPVDCGVDNTAKFEPAVAILIKQQMAKTHKRSVWVNMTGSFRNECIWK